MNKVLFENGIANAFKSFVDDVCAVSTKTVGTDICCRFVNKKTKVEYCCIVSEFVDATGKEQAFCKLAICQSEGFDTLFPFIDEGQTILHTPLKSLDLPSLFNLVPEGDLCRFDKGNVEENMKFFCGKVLWYIQRAEMLERLKETLDGNCGFAVIYSESNCFHATLDGLDLSIYAKDYIVKNDNTPASMRINIMCEPQLSIDFENKYNDENGSGNIVVDDHTISDWAKTLITDIKVDVVNSHLQLNSAKEIMPPLIKDGLCAFDDVITNISVDEAGIDDGQIECEFDLLSERYILDVSNMRHYGYYDIKFDFSICNANSPSIKLLQENAAIQCGEEDESMYDFIEYVLNYIIVSKHMSCMVSVLNSTEGCEANMDVSEQPTIASSIDGVKMNISYYFSDYGYPFDKFNFVVSYDHHQSHNFLLCMHCDDDSKNSIVEFVNQIVSYFRCEDKDRENILQDFIVK